MPQYKIANLQNIEGVLALQEKYQVDTINEEDKKDGFVTTPFTYNQLKELILNERGLFIAEENSEIAAYTMSASWEYWAEWPMFKFMLQELPKLTYRDMRLTTKNSYQYGPICIDKAYRGTGLLESLFDFSRQQMADKYTVMLTFVNKNNPRSLEAHTRKLKMTIINEFEFNGNKYYELAYETSRQL